jgi:hypothetical protein
VNVFGRARGDLGALSSARSADTAPKQLAALARHDEGVVRRAVAANPATPASTLERLAKDPDPQVRVAVAANAAASPVALRAVVAAPEGRGFAGVARRKALLAVLDHPNVTPELLRRLAADGDRLVSRRAASRA